MSMSKGLKTVLIEISPEWTKLGDEDILSKLRSTFWGRKIEDDARQWRASHPAVRDDDSNDIGPACHVFDTGLDIDCPKMWVREDYDRIYEYCKREDENGPAAGLTPSVVITGQRGVGKSFWITYAVRRRLGEEQPLLWYQDGLCFLFVNDGVYKQSISTIEPRYLVPFLWTFVDTDGSAFGVPERLAGRYSKLFVMFTTTPKPERWKALSKCKACSVIVMNVWSQEEIRQAAEIWGLTDEQKNLAQANFEELGPTPRLCLVYAKDLDARRNYVYRQRSMIARVTPKSFRKLALDLDGQHSIFTVKRYDIHDLVSAYIAPTTANVEMKIMNVIDSMQRFDQIDLYHRFAFADWTRVLAGLLYESLGYSRVEGGIALTLNPMGKDKRRTHFHWKVGSGQQATQASTLAGVDNSVTPISISANTACTYEVLQSVDPNRLYVPSARNQPGFDSFIILDGFLYLFQFTMSDEHGVKPRMVGLLRKLMKIPAFPEMAKWRFVFITPTDCDVTVVMPSEVDTFLEGVSLYSAHLDIVDRLAAARLGVVQEKGKDVLKRKGWVTGRGRRFHANTSTKREQKRTRLELT